MTVYNASLNILDTGYSAESTTDSSEGTTDDESSGTSEAEEDNYIDYEVVSETLDNSQPYMETSTAYDNTSNYAVSETDEAGNTVTYTYDVNGNVISKTDGEEKVVNYTYDASGNVTSVSSYNAQNNYSYNGAGALSAIDHNNFRYSFNYDVWGNLISTKIGNTAIASNTYNANNGFLKKTTYANGDFIEYTYDNYDNITKLTSETGVIAEFVYNKKGLVAKAVDNSSETTTYYYYDFSGTLTGEYRQTDGGDLSYFLSYDSDGNKVEKTSVNGQTKTITTGTDEDGKSYVSNDGVTAKTTTDDFGRVTEVKTSRGEGNSVFFTNYEYANVGTTKATTNNVSKLTQKYGTNELVKYEYEYDGNGNITQIKQNGVVSNKYVYDNLNQLTAEYDYINNFYINYSYDNSGNIQSKNQQYLDTNGNPSGSPTGNVYEYTDTVWKDKVTKISGDTITYDQSGNPLSYRDGITFTWQNGRQLASLQTADNSVSYKYDSNGMRTQKTDNSGTTYYYYDSDKNLIGLTKGNNTLLFYYDSDGNVTSFKHNGTIYYYIKNLQGDIVKIINQAGTVYASYVYDAWGNIKSVSGEPTLRELNPFRYHGYVYDSESGLYYLQSRYYDPFTGRFINADVYCDTATGSPLSTNMFAYCENNAIFYVDHTGYWNTSDHKKMTNDQGFSGKTYENVRNWTYMADTKGFASTNEYSAPFHGRGEALDIGKCLYNLAMDVKKNKKKYKFSESSQSGYYKLPNELKYKPKNNNKKAATNATANLISTLNNAKNYTVQWQILLGLALHTFQDYSAHVIKVELTRSTDDYYPSIQAKNVYHYNKGKAVMIHTVDETMGLPNSEIEDNINVLKWRYTFAKEITRTIYRNWTSNKKFDKFYTTQGKVYKDSYRYKRTTGSLWWKKYWYIYSLKYFYHYTCK